MFESLAVLFVFMIVALPIYAIVGIIQNIAEDTVQVKSRVAVENYNYIKYFKEDRTRIQQVGIYLEKKRKDRYRVRVSYTSPAGRSHVSRVMIIHLSEFEYVVNNPSVVMSKTEYNQIMKAQKQIEKERREQQRIAEQAIRDRQRAEREAERERERKEQNAEREKLRRENEELRAEKQAKLVSKQREYCNKVNDIIAYSNNHKDSLVIESDKAELDNLVNELYERSFEYIKQIKDANSGEWILFDLFLSDKNDAIRMIVHRNQVKGREEREEREETEERERYEKELAEQQLLASEKRRREKVLENITVVDGILTNWDGNDSNFVLPEDIAVSIGKAFRWKSSLESVELPDGILSIQAHAFLESMSLKRVLLPDSVNEIGIEAFYGCSSLCEIKLPRGINSITSQMFGKCSSLESITIPAGVKRIERGAFYGCSVLQDIILPEGITVIEDNAFENCTLLKNVILPNSLELLGKNVFKGCISLEHVVLGGGVKRIPDDCFNNHQKLQDVTIAPDIEEIGDRAFMNCQKLSRILVVNDKSTSALQENRNQTVFDSLEKIGESAFENCFVFSGFAFGEGLRSIGDRAFANCRSIKSIELIKTISAFGRGAFSGCDSLSVVIGDENVDWHKKSTFVGTPWLSTLSVNGFVIFDGYLEAYTGKDSYVSIPQGIDIIGRNAFDGNAYVSHLNINEGVTSVGKMAFANCRNLRLIHIADSVTHIEDDAFANDEGFVIQCTRGSTASDFGQRHKIERNYISKTSHVERKVKTQTRNSRSIRGDGLSGLSEDEFRVIMEMRRSKLALKESAEAIPVEPEKTEYNIVPFDESKVSICLKSDNRKITNNIFNLKFAQNEAFSETKKSAEYETFVIDSCGKIISNIKTLTADKTGDDLDHKVTYSLSAHETFDKSSAYYVVLRYKGDGTNILIKTQYQISIEFASDFDF